MQRAEKVAEALKREISQIIQQELKDTRIGFLTITRVELTKDLRNAKVYFGVLGNNTDEKRARQALKSATGFIRHLISQRLKLRFTPELIFKLSQTSAYSIKIFEELEKIKNELKKNNKNPKR